MKCALYVCRGLNSMCEDCVTCMYISHRHVACVIMLTALSCQLNLRELEVSVPWYIFDLLCDALYHTL